MIFVSSCSCLCPIPWSQVLSREWRWSWGSADRRCSNYIWVTDNFIAFSCASYIWGLSVNWNTYVKWLWKVMQSFDVSFTISPNKLLIKSRVARYWDPSHYNALCILKCYLHSLWRDINLVTFKLSLSSAGTGGHLNIKMFHASIWIPLLKIRWFLDRLNFHMGIPIPRKDGLYIVIIQHWFR